MSILARKPSPPPLVHANGRRLSQRPSRLALLQGVVSQKIRQDAKEAEERAAGYPKKRARLMILAKANLHFSDDCPRGSFVIVDPDTMEEAERAEAAEVGIQSKTLVLHPEDLDRAIEQFSAQKQDA